MQKKVSQSVLTFAKYLFWTAIAAVVQASLNHLTAWSIPEVYIPVIGAILKSFASFIATQEAVEEQALVIDGGKLG